MEDVPKEYVDAIFARLTRGVKDVSTEDLDEYREDIADYLDDFWNLCGMGDETKLGLRLIVGPQRATFYAEIDTQQALQYVLLRILEDATRPGERFVRQFLWFQPDVSMCAALVEQLYDGNMKAVPEFEDLAGTLKQASDASRGVHWPTIMIGI